MSIKTLCITMENAAIVVEVVEETKNKINRSALGDARPWHPS